MLFQTKVLLFVKLPLFFYIARLNFHLECQKIFCCQFVLIHKALFCFFLFYFQVISPGYFKQIGTIILRADMYLFIYFLADQHVTVFFAVYGTP